MPRTLGIGVYDGGQLVPMVRRSFLHTIRRSAPHVLEELRDETLPLFLTAKREPVTTPRRTKPQVEQLRKKIISGAIESSEVALVHRSFEDGKFNFDKHLSAFLQSLFDWSKRWNLNADWCLFRAFKTLNSWSRHKSYVEDLQWSTLLFGVDNPEGEPPPPNKDFPAWNVFEDSRGAYQQMIEDSARNRLINDPLLSKIESSHREDFLRELKPIVKKYQDRVERFYDKKGFERIKRQELIKHIEWTVGFQVSEMRFSEIANNSDVEPQAVAKAVKFILKLIDLKHRSAPAGRPSGSKDSGRRRIVRRTTSS